MRAGALELHQKPFKPFTVGVKAPGRPINTTVLSANTKDEESCNVWYRHGILLHTDWDKHHLPLLWRF
jgi:hypothetical protein